MADPVPPSTPPPPATPPPVTPPPPSTSSGAFAFAKNMGTRIAQRYRRTMQFIGSATVLYFAYHQFKYFREVRKQTNLPHNMILRLNLDTDLYEKPLPISLFTLAEKPRTKISVKEFIDTLQQASLDPRVRGLVVTLPPHLTVGGFAQLQELRESIQEFNKTNKFSIAFSEDFTQGNYFWASSFSKVYLQPSGNLGLVGLYMAHPFFHGTLQKLEIIPRFDHTGNHKTFANMFTEQRFTPEHRESVANLANSEFSKLVGGISLSRSMKTDDLVRHIGSGPLLSSESLQENFVDGLKYIDEVMEEAKKLGGEQSKVFPFLKYSKLIKPLKKDRKKPTIALIYGVGNISQQEGATRQYTSGITPGNMKKALKDALKEKAVKAIVLRIDSGGGDALASDTIWRFVVKAQKAGKIVVASIGNVAASGGYYIIAPCDKIVAQSGSITGSIGVVGGKFILEQFLENKLGVTVDDVTIGENASIQSPVKDFTPSQWNHFQKHVNDTYDRFVSKVAEGRKMTEEQVKAIAGGRVYTGDIAKEIGLVDEIGGLHKAIDITKEMINQKDAIVEVFPRKPSLFDQIKEELAGAGDADVPRLGASLRALLNTQEFNNVPLLASFKPVILGILDPRGQDGKPQLTLTEPIPRIDNSTKQD